MAYRGPLLIGQQSTTLFHVKATVLAVRLLPEIARPNYRWAVARLRFTGQERHPYPLSVYVCMIVTGNGIEQDVEYYDSPSSYIAGDYMQWDVKIPKAASLDGDICFPHPVGDAQATFCIESRPSASSRASWLLRHIPA